MFSSMIFIQKHKNMLSKKFLARMEALRRDTLKVILNNH